QLRHHRPGGDGRGRGRHGRREFLGPRGNSRGHVRRRDDRSGSSRKGHGGWGVEPIYGLVSRPVDGRGAKYIFRPDGARKGGRRKVSGSPGTASSTSQDLSAAWYSTRVLPASGLASRTLHSTSTPCGLGGKIRMATSGAWVSTTTMSPGVI